MRIFDMVVEQRLRVADMLANLAPEAFHRPSLCDAWTVHEVAAHLVSYLRFGQAKLYAGILATGADFDRINVLLTRWEARRPSRAIVEVLRRGADSRVTIPRSGYDPILADIVLHDMDIRVPLGIPCSTPEEHLWVAFHHLTANPSPGFTMGSRLAGLRLTASDTGWSHGTGAPVEGLAEALLLAVGGRTVAFDELTGDGVPLLRQRLASPPPRFGPLRRLAIPLNVLLNPPRGASEHATR